MPGVPRRPFGNKPFTQAQKAQVRTRIKKVGTSIKKGAQYLLSMRKRRTR